MAGGVVMKNLLVGLLSGLLLFQPLAVTNAVTDDSDQTINANQVNINANTVYLYGEKKVVKATVVRSVNNKLGLPLRATYAEIPAIVDKLIYKDKLYAVADSTNYEYTDQNVKSYTPLIKEISQLGEDILIKNDSFDFKENKYSSSSLKLSDYVSLDDALSMIYKSLGESVYSFTYSHNNNGSEPIAIEDTPFASKMTSSIELVSNQGYYTDVFVTRSGDGRYKNSAIKDMLIYADTNTSTEIELSDFCYFLYSKLDRNKEPVLTEEELEMLLVAHGRKLPLYLEYSKLVAVKHLIARGIVEDSMDFSKPVKVEDALKILARAKFKDLRLTFKNVEYQYNKDLVKQGYIPHEIATTYAPLSDVLMEYSDAAVGDTYDYYVERNDDTIFKDTSGNEVSKVYVSSIWDEVSEIPLNGTSVSIVNGGKYYHVTIPIACEADKNAFKSNSFTLNSENETDSPENLKLEEGGGVYTFEKGKLNRMPFSEEFSAALLDKERKLLAQKDFGGKQLGALTRKVNFKFKVSNDDSIDLLLWDNKPLKEYKKFKGKDVEGYYVIEVESTDPYKYVMRYLSYKREAGSNDLVQAYVTDDNNAMVSLKWLRSTGLVFNVTELIPNEKWIIYNSNESTLVDFKSKKIVAGQSVIEIRDDDTSPYIVKDVTTGDMLIDYRIVNNFSSDYVMVKDDRGNLSLTIPKKKGQSLNRIKTSYVYPLMGQSYNGIFTLSANTNFVDLEKTRASANWLIYKMRDSTNNEYLVTFRPDASYEPKLSDENKNLLEQMGIIDLKNTKVQLTRVDTRQVTDATKATNLILTSIKDTKKYGIYKDSESGKYYYKVPEVTDLEAAYANYMNGTYPLPLVKYKDSAKSVIVDLNLNLYNDSNVKKLSTYPANLQNTLIQNKILKGAETDYSATLALVGVTSFYYQYPSKGWGEVLSNSGMFYGSLPVKINIRQDEYYKTKYTFDVGNKTVYESSFMNTGMESDKPFTEVFRGSENSIYAYGVDSRFRIVNMVVKEDSWNLDWLKSFFTKGIKDVFDWDAFKTKTFFGNLDDTLTIAQIAIITLVPRVMLFIFMTFITLSLIVDNKMLGWFATHVFDPFKVLSLGLTSIDHVRTKQAWTSVFIATVFMAMLSTSILQLFGWFLQLVDYFISLM